MNSYKNIALSGLIKTGQGTAVAVIVNSHTGGTLRFNDGTIGTTGAGVKATQTLTASGVFSDGDTITINGRVYTMKTTLSTPSTVDEILIGANTAASLDNIKQAINQGNTEGGGQGEGTNYSTGTIFNTDVTATTNTATTQIIEARGVGTYGNSITTTETGTNSAWGAATLAGGAEPSVLMFNTITLATNEREVPLNDVIFVTGLYVTIGGTADITVVYK